MWFSLTLDCLHFHSLNVFPTVLYKEVSGGSSHSVPVETPLITRNTECFGTSTPGGHRSWQQQRDFLLCLLGKVYSHSLIAPAGISRQGKVWGDSCTQQCAPDPAKPCAIFWSLQTQYPLPCSLHLNTHLPSVLPSSPFLKFLLLTQPFPAPSPLLVYWPYFPDTGDGSSVNQSALIPSPVFLDWIIPWLSI